MLLKLVDKKHVTKTKASWKLEGCDGKYYSKKL